MNNLRSSLVNLIQDCTTTKRFKQIHTQLITSNLTTDPHLLSKATQFFKTTTSPHDIDYACRFLLAHSLSSFPQNSIIAAYADSKAPHTAILAYKRLLHHGFSPDMYTFPLVLKSCSKLLGIRQGRQFHGVVTKLGLLFDLYVQNALLHLYSCCRQCIDARNLFDEMPTRDVVSWTSFISGLVRATFFHQAVLLFSQMDVKPNVGTLVSVLVACGRTGNQGMGKGIHGLVFKSEFEVGLILGNALMDMYVKCTCLDEAKRVFSELGEKDAISWTCIISGLVQCKRPKEALDVFHSMQMSGVVSDKVTLSSVLSACASLGAVDYGRWVHEYIDHNEIEWDAHIGTSMVDMYAKCGSIEMALNTFHQMPCRKNVFTWNALLGGLAMHGYGKEVLDHFEQMLKHGIRPNEVTFLAVLTACCHNGLVDVAYQQFRSMLEIYNITPGIQHYGCIVDVLCRAGLLEEAQNIIKSMPMAPDVLIWGALLTACKAYGDVDTSQNILSHLLELKSSDSGAYVLLSNIFASNERWQDAVTVRNLMKEKGIEKFPGSSAIEVDGKTKEFTVANTRGTNI